MTDVKAKAEKALHDFIGEGSNFRPGQLEAIEATLTNKRTLVVQRTGWGKSMVYFICTKLLRDEGKGLTLIISPLISLMNNQLETARKAGLKCDVLNWLKPSEEKAEIIDKMKDNEIDIIFTTPETLFGKELQDALPDIKIGLLVVDEAHCISDWGHDFRLEYCRLKNVISKMLFNVPLLATTATANNHVIKDLEEQLGGNVYVSRGPLMRNNLSIQVLNLNTKTERYAWILENVPKLDGSGIIYCLTQSDCDELADFLTSKGISARSYHSGKDPKDKNQSNPNTETECLFMNNDIKVIVATVKLGMGYDKGDISFVIHYQTPQGIIAYYQQIGRAGRQIDQAYTFLMNGKEDSDIHEYFRETAFPSESEAESVYNCINESMDVRLSEICAQVNIPTGRINNTIKFLTDEGYIHKNNSRYSTSIKEFKYNGDHYEEITEQREEDFKQMMNLLKTDKCYNRFIVNALDDETEEICGCCANCLGKEKYPSVVSEQAMKAAADFLEQQYYIIEPRKQWAATAFTRMTNIAKPNEEGICLSRYGHPIYGELVKKGKYVEQRFCDKLVERSAQVLTPFIAEHGITALTYVPSQRSEIVHDFAERLARKLGIPCRDLLAKTAAEQQKEMHNSNYQCENAQKSFAIANVEITPENILLVDDMVDSGWTLAVCGDLLINAGEEHVYPYALASTSKKDE